MQICCCLDNKNFEFDVENECYINDQNVFITIDSNYEDMEYLNDIKQKYEQYGIDFTKNISMPYSTYLYDKKQNKLYLIRDIAGQRPIYYYVKNNSIFVCNDIINLMQKYNLKKEINKKCLSMYFRYDYIKPPETIFIDTYKLAHGEHLIFDGEKCEVNAYWNTFLKYNELSKCAANDYDEAKKSLEELIDNYIKNAISKNRNYGIYLSGGIDSSLVTAISSKHKPGINTFSIGFYDEERNEADKSKRIAEYFGTNHHELYVDEEKLIDIIKKIPNYYTEPFGDASELPTIVLNEFAKENNVEIALTGDGADQLFCGARLYDTLYKVQKVHRIFNPFNIYISPEKLKYRRKLMYIYSNKDKKYKSQCDILYSETFLKGLFEDNGHKRLENEEKIDSKCWQIKRLVLDFDTFICDRINTKMGIPAMKNNIEIKSPFLNKDIIEYSFRIPHKYKYYKKIKKYILKQILYKYVPKEYYDDTKKGFYIPIIKWLNTCLADDLKRVSSKEFIKEQGIFNYDVISKLIEKIDNRQKSEIIWNYYMFQLWYEKYMI